MTIFYNSKNTFEVVFALKGTIWPAVLPCCAVNVTLTLIVYYISAYTSFDPRFQEGGMSTLTTMVAFLVVSRTTQAYLRFWAARGLLTKVLVKAYQIALLANTFTAKSFLKRNNLDEDSKKKVLIWRNTVKCRIINLIRAIVDVLQNKKIVNLLEIGDNNTSIEKRMLKELECCIFGHATSSDFNEYGGFICNPSSVESYLHDTFESNRRFLDGGALLIQQEIVLHNLTGELADSFKTLCNHVSTPFPFPLVHMMKALVLVWLFLLPFYMSYNSETFLSVVTVACSIFFVTYGFFGLECVSMELDGPFGSDCNDIEMVKLRESVILSISNVLGNNPGDFIDEALNLKLKFDSTPTPEKSEKVNSENRRFDEGTIEDLVAEVPFPLASSNEQWVDIVPGFLVVIISGRNFFDRGYIREGVNKFKEALSLIQNHSIENHSTEAHSKITNTYEMRILHVIGSELYKMEEYDSALTFYEDMRPIITDALDKHDKFAINALFDMGLLYYLCGKFENCEECYMSALRGTEDIVGKQHESLSPILFNLGATNLKLIHYDWAMTNFLECLSIQKLQYGVTSKYVARTLFQIASLHYACEDKRESQRAFEMTLQIQVRIDNIPSEEVITTINALCDSFDDRSTSIGVLGDIHRFLSKRQPILNTDALLAILIKLGDLQKHDAEKALPFYELALSHHLENFGSQKRNNELLQIYIKLGDVNFRATKYETVIGYLIEAVSMINEDKGNINSERTKMLANVFATMGASFANLKQIENASKALEEGLSLMKVVPDDVFIEKASLFYDIGKHFHMIQNVEKGIECIYQAVDYARVDSSGPLLSKSLSILADMNAEIGKEELAFVYYEESLRLSKPSMIRGEAWNERDSIISKAAGLAAKLNKINRAIALYSEILYSVSNDIAKFYANLSMCHVLTKIGEYDKALMHLDSAVDFGKNYKSDCDQEAVSARRRHIAVRLLDNGRTTDAIKLLQNNLKFVASDLGGMHLEVAMTLIEISSIHFSKREISESIKNYERALTIFNSFTCEDFSLISKVYDLKKETEKKLIEARSLANRFNE